MSEVQSEALSDTTTIGRVELSVVFAALVAIVLLEIAWTDAWNLFCRHLWLDEIHTRLLVTDPDLAHMLKALAHGVDYNPPGLYLLLRAFRLPFGDEVEIAFRTFSLTATVLALLAGYAVFRQATPSGPAFLATLAIWAHPLVVRQAFEARFYTPWLAAILWICVLLNLSLQRPNWTRAIGLAVASIIVCTVHYFGVISLALAVGASGVFADGPWIRRLLRCSPAVLGVAALAACVPIYLGQKGALSVPTWVQEPTLSGVIDFVRKLFPLQWLGSVAILTIAGMVTRGAVGHEVTYPSQCCWRRLAGVGSLSLMSVALIVFSFVVQPALVPKYAIVFIPGIAALLAWTTRSAGKLLVIGGCLLLGWSSCVWLSAFSHQSRQDDLQRVQLMETIQQQAGDVMVVFEDRHSLFPLLELQPDRADQWRFLDVESELLGDDVLRIVERDVARRIFEMYGQPMLIDRELLVEEGAFFFVPFENDTAAMKGYFKGFQGTDLGHGLYQLRRAEAGLQPTHR